MHPRPSNRPPDEGPTASDDPSLERVLDHDGNVEGEGVSKLDRGLVVRIYEAMVRARQIDLRLTRLQRQGRVGFHVGAEGEEAAIIASAAALRPQDWIFPCYREIGAALWRGLPLQTYIDNMYGTADDVCKGRQMPDHVSGRDVHYNSVTAPIGTQITQAVGFAMAAQVRGQDLVTAAYFGDGATSSNDFHAAMTMAAVRKVPTVFLLRNNGWAISVPSHEQTACKAYVDKAIGYGMPAIRVDGNDALAVYDATQRAVHHAATGQGPTLVELVTYRKGPHTTSDDPNAYKAAGDPERVDAMGDPMLRLRRYLERQDAWSEEKQAAYEAEVAEEMRACIERAEHAEPPSIESMFEDVYERMPEHLREQQAACADGPRARKKH